MFALNETYTFSVQLSIQLLSPHGHHAHHGMKPHRMAITPRHPRMAITPRQSYVDENIVDFGWGHHPHLFQCFAGSSRTSNIAASIFGMITMYRVHGWSRQAPRCHGEDWYGWHCHTYNVIVLERPEGDGWDTACSHTFTHTPALAAPERTACRRRVPRGISSRILPWGRRFRPPDFMS